MINNKVKKNVEIFDIKHFGKRVGGTALKSAPDLNDAKTI